LEQISLKNRWVKSKNFSPVIPQIAGNSDPESLECCFPLCLINQHLTHNVRSYSVLAKMIPQLDEKKVRKTNVTKAGYDVVNEEGKLYTEF